MTIKHIPHKQPPLSNPRPRFQPGRDEEGFALIMALVFLVLLTLLGVLALNTSDFENMAASNVQQAEVNFSVAEGGNALEACNLGFVKRDWYRLTDPELSETPMMPTKEQDYNPGERKKPGFLSDSSGTTYTLASDYKEKEAPEKERMWPFGNLRAQEEDGKVSTAKEDGYEVGDKPYDYRYLVTYMAYDNIKDQGTSVDLDVGFGTYTFRIQTAPVAQTEMVQGEDSNETASVSQGGIVETAGLKYGQLQKL